MKKLWLFAVLAVGACAGDDFPDQHELGSCGAGWGSAWTQCERGCQVAPTSNGPGCPSASCVDDHSCNGEHSCNLTFTNTDGVIGCCVNTVQTAGEITVRFLECD